jgi:hypothetical protein
LSQFAIDDNFTVVEDTAHDRHVPAFVVVIAAHDHDRAAFGR